MRGVWTTRRALGSSRAEKTASPPSSKSLPAKGTAPDHKLADIPVEAPELERSSRQSGRSLFAAATAGAGGQVPFRSEMEHSFGQDLSGVRAHLGRRREMSALGAHAAASGENIAFASTRPDRRTVAHEVTHVLQSRLSEKPGLRGLASANSPAEREADALAPRAAAGRSVSVGVEAAAGLHLVKYNVNDRVHWTGKKKEMDGTVTGVGKDEEHDDLIKYDIKLDDKSIVKVRGLELKLLAANSAASSSVSAAKPKSDAAASSDSAAAATPAADFTTPEWKGATQRHQAKSESAAGPSQIFSMADWVAAAMKLRELASANASEADAKLMRKFARYAGRIKLDDLLVGNLAHDIPPMALQLLRGKEPSAESTLRGHLAQLLMQHQLDELFPEDENFRVLHDIKVGKPRAPMKAAEAAPKPESASAASAMSTAVAEPEEKGIGNRAEVTESADIDHLVTTVGKDGKLAPHLLVETKSGKEKPSAARTSLHQNHQILAAALERGEDIYHSSHTGQADPNAKITDKFDLTNAKKANTASAGPSDMGHDYQLPFSAAEMALFTQFAIAHYFAVRKQL